MKSGGGGDARAPAQPTPQGNHAPYGFASAFDPQYQSILPQGGQEVTAQLSDPTYMVGGPEVPLQAQQQNALAAEQAAAQAAAAAPKPGLSDRDKLMLMLVGNRRGVMGTNIGSHGGKHG